MAREYIQNLVGKIKPFKTVCRFHQALIELNIMPLAMAKTDCLKRKY